jgi:hypothetical protein
MSRDRRWTRPRSVLPSMHLCQVTYMSQIADAVKCYSHLLGQTELFKHFIDIKVNRVLSLSLGDTSLLPEGGPVIWNTQLSWMRS